jgi:hypothetical protein
VHKKYSSLKEQCLQKQYNRGRAILNAVTENGKYDLINGENIAATRMENNNSPTIFYGRFEDSAAVKSNSNED